MLGPLGAQGDGRMTTLDWHAAHHWGGTARPCIECGEPALLRDDRGRPAHKVCIEAVLDELAEDEPTPAHPRR